MANRKGSGPEPSTSSIVNPAADLDLLERARSTVPIDEFLDFGPWWYAPLLATLIGGLSLFGADVDNGWSIAAGVVAVAAGGVVAVHDHRRRTVRSRPSKRGVGFLALTLLIMWVIIAAWGTAQSSLGIERFVPVYAALAWVLTSLVLLAIQQALLAIRRRRAPLR